MPLEQLDSQMFDVVDTDDDELNVLRVKVWAKDPNDLNNLNLQHALIRLAQREHGFTAPAFEPRSGGIRIVPREEFEKHYEGEEDPPLDVANPERAQLFERVFKISTTP